MAGLVARLKRLARGEAANGPVKTVKSWMKIFTATVWVERPADLTSLAELVRKGDYCCVGASHSYNGVQVVREATAFLMKESGLNQITYDKATHEVTVGPAVTIRQLKEALVKVKRRPISSGNFMEQTVVGALVTGTHGYGPQAVMAESVTALQFLDRNGDLITLKKGDPDFNYVALSFGVIAPIVSLTLMTAETACFEAQTVICRLSEKPAHVQPGDAVMYAVFPYSDRPNPTIALQTIRPAPAAGSQKALRVGSSPFTLRAISEFIIHRYWAFDRLFPVLRRPFQRLISRLNVRYTRVYYTQPDDLDYLYDPAPGLESSRSPNILKSLLSPTYTAYNLAFFVPLAEAEKVVRFVMNQAEHYRPLGFYLKSMIGVRELSTASDLPFAGNYKGAVAAVDLFADTRDYAWLERIQREVFAYFDGVRPHWGKSAIVEEFADTLGRTHLDALKALHERHYGVAHLRTTNRVRRLFGIPTVAPQ